MYKIELRISNPMADGDSETMTFQFDPATLNPAKWSSAFDTVMASLTKLGDRSATKEPPKW